MDQPVKIELDEAAKHVVFLIPWHRLTATPLQNQREWLDKVANLREHWHAKGYKTSLRTDTEE